MKHGRMEGCFNFIESLAHFKGNAQAYNSIEYTEFFLPNPLN